MAPGELHPGVVPLRHRFGRGGLRGGRPSPCPRAPLPGLLLLPLPVRLLLLFVQLPLEVRSVLLRQLQLLPGLPQLLVRSCPVAALPLQRAGGTEHRVQLLLQPGRVLLRLLAALRPQGARCRVTLPASACSSHDCLQLVTCAASEL